MPKSKNYPDNARATDYLKAWKPEPFPINWRVWYSDVSKRLVHLSTDRKNPQTFDDSFLKKVYSAMVLNFDKFFTDAGLRDKRLENLLEKMKLEVN